jgi:hypothetical protein
MSKMTHVAMFNGPSIKSSKTSNLKSSKINGGIYAYIQQRPVPPAKDVVLKDGKWNTIARSSQEDNAGLDFSFVLDSTDAAHDQLSALVTQSKKEDSITEMALYVPDSAGEATDRILCNKVYVTEVVGNVYHCRCTSFADLDRNNVCRSAWDCETGENVYSGSMK